MAQDTARASRRSGPARRLDSPAIRAGAAGPTSDPATRRFLRYSLARRHGGRSPKGNAGNRLAGPTFPFLLPSM